MTIPNYDPSSMEAKWQEKWTLDNIYSASIDHSKPKHYVLTMWPYPSGDLHIGHWYAITPSDARARFVRMQGYNVMFPMGFDAFGLPAENAAIKHNIHPKEWTYKNIDRMRRQLKSMGTIFDWSREAISADPEYYRWTQWFFIQLYKHNLAYRKHSPVDWCPSCNTTLAREQVIGEERLCERCDTPVTRKELEQWFFKVTNYADELLDFSSIDWPDHVKTLQTNWIGRSSGAKIPFQIETGDTIEIFTTRPDTIWGVTFMALAPEHPLVTKITSPDRKGDVEKYIQYAARQSEVQRTSVDKEKTGIFTGAYAVNPANGERIPVWITDYVLMTYGTGAIMGVPAHDQRDFEFARNYKIEIRQVIEPDDSITSEKNNLTEPFLGFGHLVNSGPLSGTPTDKVLDNVIAYLEKNHIGERAVTYRLHDWLISRQRYWGAPIPMIYCKNCGWNPVPDNDLPILLPDDIEWRPTGESPLKLHPTWKIAICPSCGKEAERETDTMDTFVCSSWYHLRYLSPHYDSAIFNPEEYNYWMPVDTYTGGIEHATGHLIYTRFFHKAARDMGIVQGPEPMLKLRNQGIVLGEDNEKMSKSRGNVVAPDILVERYGADTVRTYLMFFARWQKGAPWNSRGIEGPARWLKRVWLLYSNPHNNDKKSSSQDERKLRRQVHQTLQRITNDFMNFEFNTVISGLMELLNEMYHARDVGVGNTSIWEEVTELYLLMLAPVAPHLAEELWQQIGKPFTIHNQAWPKVDFDAIQEDESTIVVQVNGIVRNRFRVSVNMSKDDLMKMVIQNKSLEPYIKDKQIIKTIYIPNKLINIVC